MRTLYETVGRSGAPYWAVFAAKQLACLTVGFLLGRTMLFDCLPSFAVALAAASPGNFLMTAVAGGIGGCLTAADSLQGALTGAAAIAAAAAINRAAAAILKQRETAVAAFVSAALCCAATGLTVQLAGSFSVNTVVVYLCEAALAGSTAYFFSSARRVVPLLKTGVQLSTSETASLLICSSAVLTAASGLAIGLFVPAGIVAAVAVMLGASAMSESGGAIVGICAGLAMELAGTSPGAAGCFALAGLVSGVFARMGQIACGISFTAMAGFYAVMSGNGEGIAVLAEAAVAAIIFILIPARYIDAVRSRLTEMKKTAVKADAGTPILKLVAAANAVTDIKKYMIRAGGEAHDARGFDFISDIVSDIADGIGRDGEFKQEESARAAGVLRSFGIRVRSVSCTCDRNGRMTVTALTQTVDREVNRTALAVEVGRACGCVMCVPSVTENGDGCLLAFSQETELRVRIGAVQHACGKNEFCGDFFETFGDGHGRQIMVISDGMGTGGNAAVDASMTAELFSSLVRSGLSFGCALRLVNEALLSKSSDEALSTLDVVCIDLYSGATEFLKAGAAATYVRKGERTAALELSALPAGILEGVSFERATAQLSKGDIIVMASDGITCGSDRWLRALLREYSGISAQELAKQIERAAEENRGDMHEDDVTVLCAIIE